MSGYIGTKAVTLSTTTANVGGDSTVGGDLTVDTNTLYVDSANNRVGVGTATPSTAILDIFTASSAQDGLKINRFATGTYYSTLRQDTHGLAIHVGDGSTISERAAITPNGITFNGDTAAANALDDYEEGTWTPSLNNGSFNGTTTARYTKIGNKVTVWLYASSMSDTTTTSALLIGGLPFSSVAVGTMDSVAGAVMLRYLDVGITEEMGVVCFVAGGSTDMRLYVLNTGTTYVAVQNSHFNNASIGLRATLTYETS